MLDFNNDGKTDEEDYFLYTVMVEEEERSTEPVKKKDGTGGIGLVLSLVYVLLFLEGAVGYGFFRWLLFVVCLLTVLARIFGIKK